MRATHAQRIITSLDICARARASHTHAIHAHMQHRLRPSYAPRYTHSVSLATSGRPVAGQGRPSFPTILSQAYIYYETPIYIYICMCIYCHGVHEGARARAEPARVENYVSDTFAVVRRNPLKSSWT